MIKVVFTDGSTELFDAVNFSHNKDHKMFLINTSENKIMIPEAVVKTIGAGHVEEFGIVDGEHYTKKERFIYE